MTLEGWGLMMLLVWSYAALLASATGGCGGGAQPRNSGDDQVPIGENVPHSKATQLSFSLVCLAPPNLPRIPQEFLKKDCIMS